MCRGMATNKKETGRSRGAPPSPEMQDIMKGLVKPKLQLSGIKGYPVQVLQEKEQSTTVVLSDSELDLPGFVLTLMTPDQGNTPREEQDSFLSYARVQQFTKSMGMLSQLMNIKLAWGNMRQEQVHILWKLGRAILYLIHIRTDYLKVLGIWYGGARVCAQTWEELITKMRQKLGRWQHRSLSIVSKNLVIGLQSADPDQYCRVAYYNVQDYMLRDTLKLGAAATKV
eukprot:g39460.t1